MTENIVADPEVFDLDALYDGFVAHLRRVGVANQAPGVGDRLAPFTLPNPRGRYVDFEESYSGHIVVLSFFRGGWCPYCRSELQGWHEAMPRLEAAGGRFLAISGEVGGRAEATRCLLPDAELLCDVDHGLALTLGLTFPLSREMHRAHAEAGLDLADIYGDSGWLLPVPATFVIDQSGVVRYAFVEPDFRVRPDPAVVIAVVEALG